MRCAVVRVLFRSRANIFWRLRHVRSEKNVSDEGSRRERYKSPLTVIGEKLFLRTQPIELAAPPSPSPPSRARARTAARAAPQWQADEVSPPPPEEPAEPDEPAPVEVRQIDEVSPPPPEAPVAEFESPKALPPSVAKERPVRRGHVVRGPVSRPRRSLDRDSKVCLELFSGKGELSAALRREALTVIAFEILRGAEYDLTRRTTQQSVLSLVRSGRVAYVHLGTPCTVWSVARRGITNWTKAKRKEEVSVALTLFSVEVFKECARCGVPVSLENPLSSKLWQFFPVRELLSLPSCRFIELDLCRFGSDYRKPTAILTTLEGLEHLALRCNHSYRHVPAAGSVRVREGGKYRWIARTTLAGSYPPQLCSRWSKIVRAAVPPSAYARPREAAALAFNFVSELEGLVRRGSGPKGHARCAASATEQQLRGEGDNVEHGCDSTVRAAAKFLRKHRVVFGGSSGARGGPEGEARSFGSHLGA